MYNPLPISPQVYVAPHAPVCHDEPPQAAEGPEGGKASLHASARERRVGPLAAAC
jgi:hypothetical protein